MLKYTVLNLRCTHDGMHDVAALHLANSMPAIRIMKDEISAQTHGNVHAMGDQPAAYFHKERPAGNLCQLGMA